MGAQGLPIAVVGGTPDGSKQYVMRQKPSTMLQQHAEQLEFGWREMDLPAPTKDDARGQVDVEGVELG